MMERSNSFQIKEIAYECGFSSPSHFTMSFRKKFQTSPSAFASLRHLKIMSCDLAGFLSLGRFFKEIVWLPHWQLL
jgi:AraC-like DNA-binding protein